MDIGLKELNRLTTLIYGAALERSNWKLFLEELHRCTDGVRTHLFGYDFDSDIDLGLTYGGYDPAAMEQYDYYADKNAWAPGFFRADAGVPVFSEWMCSREDLYKTEWYNDFIKPQDDIVGGGGVILFKQERRAFMLGGNIRRKDVDRLEAPWMQLVGLLSPHMQHAFEVARTLAGMSLEKQALVNIRNPMAAGIMAINRERRIIHTNTVAQVMLGNGTLVREGRRSRLEFADWQADRAFDTALAAVDVSRFHLPQTLALDAAGGLGLTCRIARLVPHELTYSPVGILLGEDEACFLVTLSEPGLPIDLCQLLQMRFGLTPREAEIAIDLTDGMDPRAISEQAGTSVHTVRNQIKSAMSKLDARRQIDVARIVTSMRWRRDS